MNIKLENRFENIGQEKWNALVLKSNTNTVFQTYEWHYSWWKVFGTDKELFIIYVKDGNLLSGLAPLMICKDKGGKRVLRFVGHGRSDYSDFIYINEEILESILEFIKHQSSKWDEIELHRIPSYSASSKLIENICKVKKLYCLRDKTAICSVLDIRKEPDFAQKILNKKKLIQYKNYFVKKGNYKVSHLTDKFEIMKHLQSFFQQHIERWGATETQSLFLDQKNCSFYKEIVMNMTDKGWIIFTVIESDGKPVAFHFGFTYNNRIIFYKPTFEISMSKYSPGQVLIKELLDFAVSNNFDEFDFTVGDETYKRRFANKFGENISYKIFQKYRIYWFYKKMNTIRENMRKHKIGSSVLIFGKQLKEKIC